MANKPLETLTDELSEFLRSFSTTPPEVDHYEVPGLLRATSDSTTSEDELSAFFDFERAAATTTDDELNEFFNFKEATMPSRWAAL